MARPREFDERAVLKAAGEQFWSTGYAGTSMDAIATATGLGKGSLYNAFGDKHALFLRVFGDYCERIRAAAQEGLSGPDDTALERLSDYVQGIAVATAQDTRHRGCLLAKGTAELAEHDPELLAQAHAALGTLEQALTANVAAAQRNGDLDAAADPESLALLLLAAVRGIEALGKAGEEPAKLCLIAESALSALPRAPARSPAPARVSNS